MITDAAEFQKLYSDLKSVTRNSARLPAPVFREDFKTYHFLDFDKFSSEEFWSLLRSGQRWSDPLAIAALKVAREVVNGELGIIDGCRALSALGHLLGNEYAETMSVFTAVDSETDHLPSGRTRAEWNPIALEAKDIEITRLERHFGPEVIQACQALIDELSAIDK